MKLTGVRLSLRERRPTVTLKMETVRYSASLRKSNIRYGVTTNNRHENLKTINGSGFVFQPITNNWKLVNEVG